jgi:hypothetical protein
MYVYDTLRSINRFPVRRQESAERQGARFQHGDHTSEASILF